GHSSGSYPAADRTGASELCVSSGAERRIALINAITSLLDPLQEQPTTAEHGADGDSSSISDRHSSFLFSSGVLSGAAALQFHASADRHALHLADRPVQVRMFQITDSLTSELLRHHQLKNACVALFSQILLHGLPRF